jgi:hypothetical protein
MEKTHRCLFDNGEIKTLLNLPPYEKYHSFELFKGYEATDDGLVKFKSDFDIWCHELLHNDILDIEYTKYFNHRSAVELTFQRLCKGRYEHFDEIDKIESNWIEATHNGGLTYCNPGTYQTYGYDFSSFYPRNMADYNFIFPTKKGKEQFITELPDDFKLGFYRVKITSDHKHATKLFSFSKNNVYTNITLKHAQELCDDYNFKMELIVDDKPNAYIYDKGIKGHSVFGTWLNKLLLIKKQFPKNKLVKHLLSSVWGTLTRYNKITKKYEDIEAEKLKICLTDKADYKILDYIWTNDQEFYTLQCMGKPYKMNFRLKSFLTAFGRVKTARIAEEDLDSCVRIHTDGIVFNKEMKFYFDHLLPEDKTTGLINWINVNNYSLIS